VRTATTALLFLGLLLAPALAPAAKRDLDVERISAALDRLTSDPARAALAAPEIIRARSVLDVLPKARGKDERAHLVYLAEHLVDIALATAEAAQSERKLIELEREHDRILLEAARHDAEMARLESEKLRLQALAQEEETQRARELQVELEAQQLQSARELEAARATTEQAKRLAAAQAQEAQLARRAAELSRQVTPGVRAQMQALTPQPDARGMVMTLGEGVFAPGSATLQPEVLRELDRIVDFANSDKSRPLLIEGHTDDHGSARLNQELSQDRADALKQALVKRGVAAKRITAVGKGDAEPVARNDTEEGRAQNRRVEVILEDR
jgi:outer membrane protein OmpA-like peptidoglycan-associated protein